MDALAGWLVLVSVIAGVTAWGVRQIKLHRAVRAVYERLRADQPLFCPPPNAADFRLTVPGGVETGWQGCLCALMPDNLIVYRRKDPMDERHDFPLAALRWFGRPQKYHDGDNEIWLHFALGDGWRILKLRMTRYYMVDLVRTLKTLVPAELVTAYRRQRPYVHYGPVRAQPAEQDLYGVWTLNAAPVLLYVMPLHLVMLRDGKIERTIPLERVKQVAALERVDAPDADGIARFQVDDLTLAFSLPDYGAFGAALAEAAKRSLELPFVKKKDDEEEEW